MSKSTRQDWGISVGGTAVHLECNLCFIGQLQSSCKEKCVCPVKKTQKTSVPTEKTGTAGLAGEGSMLHCTEGWEGGWQLWTSESCSVRISAPSLQQARCRMKGGIAWVSTLQGKQEILLRIYAVPAKSLPHLKQKQPAFSLSWLCSCWQRAALQSRPVPALYGEIQHQEMG